MVNVKMEILNVVAKWGGSVTGDSASTFLSTCFSLLALNSSIVFSMAFTSSSLALIFVPSVLVTVFRFSLLFTVMSSVSL